MNHSKQMKPNTKQVKENQTEQTELNGALKP